MAEMSAKMLKELRLPVGSITPVSQLQLTASAEYVW
jgi:hypothetical protein